MSKLGGGSPVGQCRSHLASGELLGVTGGIRGAFTMYKRAIDRALWRNDCVRFALRHQVPIVPFVTIGSARSSQSSGGSMALVEETDRVAVHSITTPVPLPSKWHTEFLEPLHVDGICPEAADDPAIVRAIATELKERMEAAVPTWPDGAARGFGLAEQRACRMTRQGIGVRRLRASSVWCRGIWRRSCCSRCWALPVVARQFDWRACRARFGFGWRSKSSAAAHQARTDAGAQPDIFPRI